MSSELDRLAGGGCGQAGSGEGVRAVTDEVLDAATQTGADASQTVAEHIQLAANHSALPAAIASKSLSQNGLRCTHLETPPLLFVK